MDTTDCPVNYGTDLLDQRINRQTCEIPLVPYAALVTFCLVCRVLLSALQIKISVYLADVRSTTTTSTQSRTRHCMGIPLSTSMEMANLIFFAMAMLIPNFSVIPGFNRALFGAASFTFLFSFFASLLKIVHLGQKVLPKSLRTENNDLSTVRSDRLLFANFVLMMTFNCIGLIGFIIPLFDRNNEMITLYSTSIGCVSFGLSAVAASNVSLRQTQRIINHISSVQAKVKDIVNPGTYSDNNSTSKSNNDLLKRTMKNLRMRTIGIFFGSFPSIVVWISSGVFGLRWYLAILIFIFATIGSGFFTVVYIPKAMKICGFALRKPDRSSKDSRPKSKSSKSDRVAPLTTESGKFNPITVMTSQAHNMAEASQAPITTTYANDYARSVMIFSNEAGDENQDDDDNDGDVKGSFHTVNPMLTSSNS